MNDREAMERAVALAWGGWGRVGANPLVGAVVRAGGAAGGGGAGGEGGEGGEVVGEGFHAEFGGPHGEVLALRAAGERARGADLFVTLEPCAHHGKTPPCADAIVAAGVRRVVFAAPDADPVARGGAQKLADSGVRVDSGLLESEVRAQNALFFHRHSGCARPFVAVKLALSLDARIADSSGRSRWLSGEEARELAHWLRAGFEAVAVGAGTARADDPRLTPRGAVQPPRPPLRVVFDRRAELAPTSQLVRTARELPTLAVVGAEASADKLARLEAAGVASLRADSLDEALVALRRRGVANLLVEGGGTLAGRLVHEGLADRLYLLVAPLFLGERAVGAFRDLPGWDLEESPLWRPVERRALGRDTLLVLDRR